MSLTDDRSPSHVIYPESDDQPMSESVMQGLTIRTLMLGFERLYHGRGEAFVFSDQFWYPVAGEPKIVVAPDTMVVLGLPQRFTRARSAATASSNTGAMLRSRSRCCRPATRGLRCCASGSSTTATASMSTG